MLDPNVGRLVDHIQVSQENLTIAEDELRHVIRRFGGAAVEDYFKLAFSQLPAEERRERLDQRLAALGLDDDTVARLATTPDFIIRKDASSVERGFGQFALDRSEFIGKSHDEIAAKLHYTLPSWNFADGGGSVTDLIPSATAYENAFIKSIAGQMANPELVTGSRLVFDIETAGLEKNTHIWQLSARLIGEDGSEQVENFFFDAAKMEGGLYEIPEGHARAGEVVDFAEYRKAVFGVAEPHDRLASMRRFLQMADSADYLVGQNVGFDIGHIVRTLESMESQFRDDGEMWGWYEAFKSKAASDSGAVIDTRILASALVGKEVNIASEILKKGQATSFSIENILLQTNLVDVLADDYNRVGLSGVDEAILDTAAGRELLERYGGNRGMAIVASQIQQSLHNADLDTWVTGHLERVAFGTLSGQREADGLLNWTGTKGSELQDKMLRGLISSASALTPLTRSGADNITGLERLVGYTRDFDSRMTGAFSPTQLDELMRLNGVFDSFVEPLLTEDGTLRANVRLNRLDDALLNAAEGAENLPFAGLSNFERIMSTLLGRSTNRFAPSSMNEVRKLAGGLVGSGLVDATKVARVYGEKNIALPMQLLLDADNEIGTNFHRALSKDGVQGLQSARLSAFEWVDPEDGMRQLDIALIADIDGKQAENLAKFLGKLSDDDLRKYGIESVDEVLDALQSGAGEMYGIQVGKLAGRNNRSVAAVARLMKQMGFGIDARNGMAMRTLLMNVGQDVTDMFGTTPVYLDGQDELVKTHTDYLLGETQRAQQLQKKLYDSAGDEASMGMLRAAKAASGANELPKGYQMFKRAFTTNVPKKAGIAGVALGGYYYMKQRKDRQTYQDTMATQEFEPDGFYPNYKAGLNEPVLASISSPRSMDPMATSYLVGDLDRNKTGHHKMGSDKNSHLFGGM